MSVPYGPEFLVTNILGITPFNLGLVIEMLHAFGIVSCTSKILLSKVPNGPLGTVKLLTCGKIGGVEITHLLLDISVLIPKVTPRWQG